MELGFIVLGILLGKAWTGFVHLQLRRLLPDRGAAARLSAYIAVSIGTGAAIGLLELALFSSALDASAFTKGALIGFVWSPGFVTNAHLLYRRRHVGHAICYLIGVPALIALGLFSGYASLHLGYPKISSPLVQGEKIAPVGSIMVNDKVRNIPIIRSATSRGLFGRSDEREPDLERTIDV